jgi:adenosylmethionine-8-amino-7-oxononanoate aminotransferase
MTGVGRTGTFLAIEGWDVQPDLVVLAKGLSSGYQPLAAILIHNRVFRAFEEHAAAFIGGHTYNAHPVTAAAGIAVLDYMQKHRLMDGVAAKGALLERGLRSMAEDHPMIGEIRGRGLMWGIEFVQDRQSREPFDPHVSLAKHIMLRAMERGLIIYPVVGLADGQRGDGVLICPPLVIEEGEIETLLSMLAETLRQVGKERGG